MGLVAGMVDILVVDNPVVPVGDTRSALVVDNPVVLVEGIRAVLEVDTPVVVDTLVVVEGDSWAAVVVVDYPTIPYKEAEVD